MKKAYAVLALGLSLSACATSSPYYYGDESSQLQQQREDRNQAVRGVGLAFGMGLCILFGGSCSFTEH